MSPGSATLTIRSALGADASEVHALVVALGYPERDRESVARSLAILLQTPRTHVLLAHAGGPALGLLVLSLREALHLGGALATIDELAVAEAARGQGVGAALVARARGVARSEGARRLELTTRRTRESYLRGFYVKQGFTEAPSAVFRLELEPGCGATSAT